MEHDGILYKVESDGLIILKGSKNINKHIVIPENICGYNVVGIDNFAFREATNLTTIILPGSIKRIGDYAFYSCTNLINVRFTGKISENFVILGQGSFYGCTHLTTFDRPVFLTKHSAFMNCPKLERIAIYGDIQFKTFSRDINLKEIHWFENKTIPSTYNAFDGCISLKKIYVYADDAKLDKTDLINLKDSAFYCEHNCAVSELAYEGYQIMFVDYN